MSVSYLTYRRGIVRYGGFTLVEILVVVAILGVLMAVTIPALNGAVGNAHSMKTVSNLKQLQAANIAFAAEHDGYFVPNWPASSAAYQNGWWQWGEFVSYLGGANPENLENLGWDAWPEVAKTGIVVSPLVAMGGDKGDRFGTIAMNQSRFSHWTGGGTMPAYNTAHNRVGMIKQNLVSHPNEFIVFGDGSGYYIDFLKRMDWANLPSGKQDQQAANGLAFRNSGKGAFVVVASGAVKSLRPADISVDSEEVQRMFYYNGKQ